MIQRTIILTVFCLVATVIANRECIAQNRSHDQTFKSRSPFRWVIVNNQVDPSLGDIDPDSRFVEILLDRKAFSKENLITLVRRLSSRFPKPGVLFINVFTSLEDIETPDERDESRMAHSRDRGENPSPSATFVRIQHNKAKLIIDPGNGRYEEFDVILSTTTPKQTNPE